MAEEHMSNESFKLYYFWRLVVAEENMNNESFKYIIFGG